MLDFKPDEIKTKLVEFYERLHDQKQQILGNLHVNDMIVDKFQAEKDNLIVKLLQQLVNDAANLERNKLKAEARIECGDFVLKAIEDEEKLKLLYNFMVFSGMEEVQFAEEKTAEEQPKE